MQYIKIRLRKKNERFILPRALYVNPLCYNFSMGEGGFDANVFGKALEAKLSLAASRRVEVLPGEFKILDLHIDKSDQKWVIVGSDPTLPMDMEVAVNPSPEVSLIAIKGTRMDKNVFAFKIADGSIQIKPLSPSQDMEVQTLDGSNNVVQKDNVGPMKTTEQRHNVSFQNKHRAMLFLGPDRSPIRIFQRVEEGRQAIRMVINPPIGKLE